MLVELTRSSLRSIAAHRLRFALTSLGIAWGTLMLAYLTAYMTGLHRHYEQKMRSVGPRITWIFSGVILKEGVGGRNARALQLDNDDIPRLDGLRSVSRMGPNLGLGARMVRSPASTKLLWTFGVSAESMRIRNYVPAEGRTIRELDVRRNARVVFFGHEAARRTFGRRSAVGQVVHIDGIPFRVIGVAQEKGDQLMNTTFPDDEHVLIPYTTAQRWMRLNDEHEILIYEPRSPDVSRSTMDSIRLLLGLHHRFDPGAESAVSFFAIEEALALMAAVFGGLKVFLIASALVTLFVGAIGVMNIMLVVVAERTREIGLRKAIGAPGRAIFVEFFYEALVITALSGALGASVAWLLIRATSLAAAPGAVVPELEAGTLVLLAVALGLVGLVSGALPALRAARVDPAVSLRSL